MVASDQREVGGVISHMRTTGWGESPEAGASKVETTFNESGHKKFVFWDTSPFARVSLELGFFASAPRCLIVVAWYS